MGLRRRAVVVVFAGVIGVATAWSQTAPPQAGAQRINLPTSKVLNQPVPGDPQRLNSFPANLAVSPDGRYVAILNAGWGTREANYGQSIALLDRQQNTVVDFPDPRVGRAARQAYFYGIAFSADGRHVYCSLGSITDPTGAEKGDTGNGIAVYRINNGALEPERFIAVAPQPLAAGKQRARALNKAPDGTAPPFPAGIAVVPGGPGERLLVADNLSDDALLLDAADGRVLQRFDLSRDDDIPSSYPFAVAVARDGQRAWVSLWNASEVAALDLTAGSVSGWIRVRPADKATGAGSHPTAMLLSPDGRHLYVTLSNRDEVAVIETAAARVLSFLSTRLPGQQYGGVYPVGLAQSADGRRLYVANASADAVAVIDVPRALKRRSNSAEAPAVKAAIGFIPTEWYPTSLAVIGDELLVASGKGRGTGANAGQPPTPGHVVRGGGAYLLSLVAGSVARIRIADAERDRKRLTRAVLDANRMTGRLPAIAFRGRRNPIRHVIYVIKENRTYDQMFGDIKEANGDPALVMYGEEITPNHHRLARQFGVLDNFYDSGEVSGDGHVWSTAAIGSDYTERVILLSYRGKERTYDFEGQVASEVPLEQGIADVNEPATGYFWGNAARHGRTVRAYAEYVAMSFCDSPEPVSPHQEGERIGSCERKFVEPGQPLPAGFGDPPGGPSPYPWRIPLIAQARATKPELIGHFDPHYATFNQSYPDQLRADEFLREFAGFVRARREGNRAGELPNFIIMKLPNDHTAGTRAGSPSPAANVADNDLALGRIVEAVSHSPYWDDTAICVLEDDAQNGQDHVDAHRSIALVISKYAPLPRDGKPFVDSTFYTTVNMIRTMEVLLGLPPMNNNDARAAAMAPLFGGPGTQPPYKADWRNRDNGLLYKANPAQAPGAASSAKMDFSRPDGVDTEELNRILWREAKGDVPMPAPKHTVIPDR